MENHFDLVTNLKTRGIAYRRMHANGILVLELASSFALRIGVVGRPQSNEDIEKAADNCPEEEKGRQGIAGSA